MIMIASEEKINNESVVLIEREYTPEIIKELPLNTIFVFGSNNLGNHAGGAASIAVNKFGAKMGIPMGLQGDSYGIITTSFTDQPIDLEFIKDQICVLYWYALNRPELTFYVTKIGTGIAGFATHEIAELFTSLKSPNNIVLPKEFTI